MGMTTTNDTALTAAELETIKAKAEKVGNYKLVWACDGALAGDVGALARVKLMTR